MQGFLLLKHSDFANTLLWFGSVSPCHCWQFNPVTAVSDPVSVQSHRNMKLSSTNNLCNIKLHSEWSDHQPFRWNSRWSQCRWSEMTQAKRLGVRSSINTTLSLRKHHTLPRITLVSELPLQCKLDINLPSFDNQQLCSTWPSLLSQSCRRRWHSHSAQALTSPLRCAKPRVQVQKLATAKLQLKNCPGLATSPIMLVHCAHRWSLWAPARSTCADSLEHSLLQG
jgi:hypothetical protein